MTPASLELVIASDGLRRCGWCEGPIPPRKRRDALYCSTSCRQAAHRTKVEPSRSSTGETARLAYADPPYVGKARRYYGDQPTFAGEVDHLELLDRLATYDGWALSCSSSSVPSLAAAAVARGLEVRLAIWHRRPAPHPHAGLLTAFEGVIYHPARPIERGPDGPLFDVLTGVEGRRRSTLPRAVIGMKPPAFSAWLFRLLGARPTDRFDDLYPGSGLVSRAWDHYRAAVAPDLRDAMTQAIPDRPPVRRGSWSPAQPSGRDPDDASLELE